MLLLNLQGVEVEGIYDIWPNPWCACCFTVRNEIMWWYEILMVFQCISWGLVSSRKVASQRATLSFTLRSKGVGWTPYPWTTRRNDPPLPPPAPPLPRLPPPPLPRSYGTFLQFGPRMIFWMAQHHRHHRHHHHHHYHHHHCHHHHRHNCHHRRHTFTQALGCLWFINVSDVYLMIIWPMIPCSE